MALSLEESVAHSPAPGSERWDFLTDHSLAVARCAEEFAHSFDSEGIAFLTGLLHDLGKRSPEWQGYIRASDAARRSGHRSAVERSIPHAIWGAAVAYLLWEGHRLQDWEEIGLAILGHHAGLHDAGDALNKLRAFSKEHEEALLAFAQEFLRLPSQRATTMPKARDRRRSEREREMFARLLFSALVDADFLATEAFGTPDAASARGGWPAIEDIVHRFECSSVDAKPQTSAVKAVREEVLAACLTAAGEPTGFFRLTSPTGAGKTRSSLAFALEHAKKHGLRRVIVALPYTSIIDQTANEFRKWLGADAVLEHHSAIAPATDRAKHPSEMPSLSERSRQLASENWDAPVIVTTTVQLFESMFGNRSSKTRKLHRIAESVVILDEIQTFPVELLEPAIDALHFFATPKTSGGCGSTVVFCTATQPRFEQGKLARLLPEPIREIAPGYPRHFAALNRVTFEVRSSLESWESIATEVATHPQALVVLNSRKDALNVLALIDHDDVFHLSTLLCGAHRKTVLKEVTKRLRDGRPVTLVSTQVVECGVDLDFPIGYRALGPLDRIAQTAGRVNRNGLLGSESRLIVFVPEQGGMPKGAYLQGTEKAKLILLDENAAKLNDPTTYERYFQMLHGAVDLDKHKIQAERAVMNYPEVADRFRLIDSVTWPVVVPYGAWEAALARWKHAPNRDGWRGLQPFVVNVFDFEKRKYERQMEELSEGLFLWNGVYDSERHKGIVPFVNDPSDLFI